MPPTDTVVAVEVTPPTVLMTSWSWAATVPAPNATVSVPVLKLALLSAITALAPTSSWTVPPPSVKVAVSPIRLVAVGAALGVKKPKSSVLLVSLPVPGVGS